MTYRSYTEAKKIEGLANSSFSPNLASILFHFFKNRLVAGLT